MFIIMFLDIILDEYILNSMKKYAIFLSLIALGVAGCTPRNEPTSVPSSSSEEESYRWSKEIDSLLKESLGEYVELFPVIENATYEASNTYNAEYELTYTTLYAYGNFSSESAQYYALGLQMNGFTRSYNESSGFHSCTLQVSYTTIVAAQIGFSQADSCIMMSLYKNEVLHENFPKEKVVAYVGEEVPDPELPYYAWQKLTVQSTEYFAIYCYPNENETFTASVVSDYSSKLTKAGYTLDDLYAVYGNYYAYSKNGKYTISYGLDPETGYFLIALSLN